MRYFKILSTVLFLISCCRDVTVQSQQSSVILNEPGFPYIFELDPGESHVVTRSYKGKSIEKEIKLTSVEAFTEPNYWFTGPLPPSNYYQFLVELEIGGEPATLFHRPYQMPVTIGGLRIYIENIKQWDESAQLGKCGDMEKEVRIAVCLEDEPWGPRNIVFPINGYVWRSAVYYNTWSSLVPFNKLYYHRGEDYGAIPGKLEVVAPIGGVVTQTPLPDGDGGSNAIYIEGGNGLKWRLSHMDIENINPGYPAGAGVSAGTVLAKTGMTWDGRQSQSHDHPGDALQPRVPGAYVWMAGRKPSPSFFP